MTLTSANPSQSAQRPRSPMLFADAAWTLRPRQIAWRLRRAVPPRILAAGCARGRMGEWRSLRAPLLRDDAPQSGPTPPPHESGSFTAFGHERQASRPDLWSDDGVELLFRFHLHGFSDLTDFALSKNPSEAGSRFWTELVELWLDQHRRPSSPAWHPYPTSERVIAWCVALSRLPQWPASLRGRVAREVWRQGRYLRRSIEHDIGGNHVLRNGIALCFAGAVVPDSRLSTVGLRLLEREVRSQFLADGGHEERSTSYHRRILLELENVRSILGVDGGGSPSWLSDRIDRGREWERALSGPDGTIPMLNDAWTGPPLAHSAKVAPLTILKDSGLVVLRRADDQLIVDAGPLCPPHLPAHAHADALSFVLWWRGDLLLADPGAFAYSGASRDRFRGTASHSTVSVDDQDQCLFWGDFRASKLPRVRFEAPERIDDAVVLRTSHDGYTRLADPVTHERTFIWLPGDGVVVVDTLACRERHHVRSTLRASPGIDVSPEWMGPLAVAALGAGASPEIITMPFAPFLGTQVEAEALVIAQAVGPREPFGWSLLREGVPVPRLTERAVTIERAEGTLDIALQPPSPSALPSLASLN